MLLHHADGAVLERLADAGHWEVRLRFSNVEIADVRV